MARHIPTRVSRRGVLLLLVLALLAMFGLLAISFVVISGQAKRGAEAVSKRLRLEDSPRELMGEAIAQVLRGTNSSVSGIGAHSLLEDLYGGHSAYGEIQSVSAVVGGQLLNLTIDPQLYANEELTNPATDDPTRHLGSVLTMLDGLARGKSTRIVGAQSSPAGVQIVAFDGVDSQAFLADCNAAIASGRRLRFLLNGAPFGGTGFGYDPSTGQMGNLALQPRDPANVNPPGGANEDYDAPDYQNMLLAMMLPDGRVPLPSLHRPELIQYWIQQMGQGNWDNNQNNIQDKTLFRPLALATHHPNFNGSNTAFNPIWDGVDLTANHRWDVDNDGDGIADSIWVDLGIPVRATRDGRTYKPLFAILCLDMDGRLNLNAHGNGSQLASEYDQSPSGPFAGTTGPSFQVPLPRGEGYGPAEIRIPPTMIPEVAQLLHGNPTAGIEGRYGEIAASPPQAGLTNTWDGMTRVKFFEFPENSYLDAIAGGVFDGTKLTSFGSPPDLWGRAACGVDFAGNPLYWRPTTYNGAPDDWWSNEVLNNPYRLDLSLKGVRRGSASGGGIDNPFTAAELERVLRNYDADAGKLPRRLVDLAPSLVAHRTEVTTDSFDVPCPPASQRLSPELPNYPTDRAHGLVDLLARKLAAGGVPQAQIPQQVRRMLSWDLLANRRMDLNRPLGNARDSNGNNVVDEWQEATSERGWFNIFPRNSNIPPAPPGTTDSDSDGKIDTVTFWLANAIDVNGDGNVDAADQLLARHLLARHLYVLGMLLAEIGYQAPGAGQPTLFFFPTPGEDGLSDDEKRELTSRRVAQWAVNVVDFRDADAIMTPFEYDANPFNGWSVDGDINTIETNPDRRVVWGCEAPELLLTEVLAFHDRRVADTSFDSTGKKRTDDTNNDGEPDDVDLDQPLIPRGSAFFELYCPRNPNNPVAPTDLYTFNGGQWYLDVGRLAPPGAGNLRYPVWRIAVSESRIANSANDVYRRVADGTNNNRTPHSASLEPKQQRGIPGGQSKDGFSLLPGTSNADVEIDRIVWLAPLAPTASHLDHERVYYNRTATTGIACGGYAVVGPRFTTPIGGTTNLGEPSPHAIHLDAVGVIDNDGTNRYPTPASIKPAASIVAAADPPNAWGSNSPAADLDPTASHGLSGPMRYGIGISISEPIPALGAYYPEPTEANTRNGNLVEAYCDVSTGKITGNPMIMDHPFDSDGGPATPTRPLGKDNLLRTQTTLNYKTVFLQRLADPGRPYQPDPNQPGHNPYVTVDWSPIDLTVFNGADRLPGTAIPGNYPWDTYDDGQTAADDNPNADAPGSMRFASRQRGGHVYAAGSVLWAWTDFPPPQTVNIASQTNLNFRHNLGWTGTTAPDPTQPAAVIGQTVGYVNRGYGMPWTPPANPPILAMYRGTPAEPGANPTTDRLQPFPWLAWNNRPFATPLELLLVPTSSSARLCWEFSAASNVNELYTGPATTGTSPVFGIPFGHLLNFFQADKRGAGDPEPPKFYRLFDFVEVPSRFLGAEVFLNPQYAGRPDVFEQHLHRPPFNAVSSYRDPGKVNINTIASQAVWEAVLNGHAGPTFDQLVESRRGYGSGGNPALMDASFPTRFANPFRSASSADLCPPMPNCPKQRPVNVTLLRASGPNPDASNTPLFADPNAINEVCRNPNQHAYFRYQSLARLGNLVTTRSNVYAVWITAGYFEAERNPGGVDAAHPDGYRLGRELGSDTGEIRRHRAFYLIDRSIPVGFARGKDYNVTDTILLSRFIE